MSNVVKFWTKQHSTVAPLAKVLIQSFEFLSISIAFYKHFNTIQRRAMQKKPQKEIKSLENFDDSFECHIYPLDIVITC